MEIQGNVYNYYKLLNRCMLAEDLGGWEIDTGTVQYTLPSQLLCTLHSFLLTMEAVGDFYPGEVV